MNKILITGSSGNIGEELIKQATKKGLEVECWNRKEIPINNFSIMREYLKTQKPDVIYHLATAPAGSSANEANLINYTWPSEIAWLTRGLGIKFVYTSSVMVYTEEQSGPFHITTTPMARLGIGAEKIAIEDRLRYQNPNAIAVRLGWQIGQINKSSNMMHYLVNEMQQNGVIRVSSDFYPSCSFVEDTAKALLKIAAKKDAGLFLLNGNEKWSFYEIAMALKEYYQTDWIIEETHDYVYNQLMFDDRVAIKSIESKLKSLGTHTSL